MRIRVSKSEHIRESRKKVEKREKKRIEESKDEKDSSITGNT